MESESSRYVTSVVKRQPILMKLRLKFRSTYWDTLKLSSNRAITIEFIDKHRSLGWDWVAVSKRDDITPYYIERLAHLLDFTSIFNKRNLPLELLYKYHDKIWDWYAVSENINLDLNFIKRFKDHLNWVAITMNKNFTIDDILNNLDLPWQMRLLPIKKGVTIEVLGKLKVKSDMNIVSYVCNIEWDYRDVYDYSNLSQNPHLTTEFILRILQEDNNKPWSWRILIERGLITEQTVHDHPEINWPYLYMINRGVTLDFVDKCCPGFFDNHAITTYYANQVSMQFIDAHPNMDYDWYALSLKPNLTYDFVVKYILADKPWNYEGLTFTCSSFIMDLIDRFPKIRWDWTYLSKEGPINIDFVVRHPKQRWVWKLLTKNPNITLNDILSTPHLPWHKPSIGGNKHLTYEYAVEHFYQIGCHLSDNMLVAHDLNDPKNVERAKQEKRKFITSATGMVLDLAEIIAIYCGYL